MVFVRGDHRVNDDQARERARRALPPGARRGASCIGPAGLPRARRPASPALVRRRRRRRAATSSGANRARPPPRGVDVPAGERARRAQRSRRATRVGGSASASSRRSRSATSSSSARATPSRSARPTSTRTASEQPIVMGSYGIGPARIAAAAVEQFADEQGIAWPQGDRAVGRRGRRARQAGHAERAAAEALYEELRAAGLEVALDDRDAGTGREVRRRRAARLPAAPDGRQALAGVRAPPRPRSRRGQRGPRRRRAARRAPPRRCARAVARETSP